MPVYDRAQLEPALRPWRLHLVSRCASTSDLAARLRKQRKLYAPAVVVTPHQHRGRGRGSNVWRSDAGTLTATFVLPVDGAHPPHHLPILAGLALRDAVVTLFARFGVPREHTAWLKWPNDLMLEGEDGTMRKLAGMLCERVDNADLIGIGLNVATDLTALPPDVQGRATSLELAGLKVSLSTVLLEIARQLLKATEIREPFAAVLRRYDTHHLLVGKRVEVRTPTDAGETTLAGTCTGLDAQGRLLLSTPAGTERVVSGVVVRW